MQIVMALYYSTWFWMMRKDWRDYALLIQGKEYFSNKDRFILDQKVLLNKNLAKNWEGDILTSQYKIILI